MITSFTAIDVETANADLASICQIGIVAFVDGEIVSRWESLVDPEDFFDAINVSIHGIDEETVRDAPHFPDIADRLTTFLNGKIVVSHMPFDRLALLRVQEKYQLPRTSAQWLDTARVCRRAWTQFSRGGYGLAELAAWCRIDFRHHNASEDARAAGLLLLRAMSDTGFGITEWISRAQRPIDPQGSRPTRTGNPAGPLFGEVVVFTGALSMLRREAADLAAGSGCAVAGSVGKTTTLLVVGDQDVRRMAGHTKSAKHRKAEALIASGQAVRILCERDFRALVDLVVSV